jgi:hypothetical protein
MSFFHFRNGVELSSHLLHFPSLLCFWVCIPESLGQLICIDCLRTYCVLRTAGISSTVAHCDIHHQAGRSLLRPRVGLTFFQGHE